MENNNNGDKKVSKTDINKIINHNNIREKTGVGLYEQPLTPQQLIELKQWKDYQSYDQLLEDRNRLILEIDRQKEVLGNLKIAEEEYKGGLGNYRAKELNNGYHLLSRLVDCFIGFLCGSIIYGGVYVYKRPSLWIFFSVFALIMMYIGILEGKRYRELKRGK